MVLAEERTLLRGSARVPMAESARSLVQGLRGAVAARMRELLRRMAGKRSVREMDEQAAVREELHAQYMQRLHRLCGKTDQRR